MKNRIVASFAVFLGMLLTSASAQVSNDPGVARVSLIHGDVSTQRGDSGDWAAAALNAPVVSGDKVSTGEKSRIELQLDYANLLRLSERTQANASSLTRTQIQVQVSEGLANYSVLKGSEADVEIDTPNVSIRPDRREGSYRILVNGSDETQVIVRKGEAEVSTPQGSTRLEKGQLMTIRGTGDNTQFKITDAPSKDDWDSWVNDRDHMIRNAEGRRNTNRYYVGSEDLDAYGRWSEVPDYGRVWVPVVDAGWAPYRAGRWVWEPYYGWTWVSYEPWGWAPYHYGRWFYHGSSWVWWPGPVRSYYRPIWAPAYVSFFGFGGRGFGFGFGFGSVGWLPTGPCDSFYPWSGRYRNHYNVGNITNVTNITNITNINNIHNRPGTRVVGGFEPLKPGNRDSNIRRVMTDERMRNAVSTVPENGFGRGHAVTAGVTPAMLKDGHVVAGNLPVVPTRESLRVSDKPVHPSTVVQHGPERFFAKRVAPTPQSFEKQAEQVQKSIEHDGHFQPPVRGGAQLAVQTKPGAGSPTQNNVGGEVNNPRRFPMPKMPAVSQTSTQPAQPSTGSPAQSGTGGEVNNPRRFPMPKTPVSNQTSTQPAQPGGGDANGWRRFGNSSNSRGNSTPTQQPGSDRKPVDRKPMDQGGSPHGVQPRTAPAPATPPARPSAPSGDGWQKFSGGSRSAPGSDPHSSSSDRRIGNHDTNSPRTSQPEPARSAPERSAPVRSVPERSERNDGWRKFTPTQRSSSPDATSRGDFGGRGTADRGDNSRRGGMDNAPVERREPVYRESDRGSRPPLDMRQPVVVPRESRGESGPPRGGFPSGASPGGGGERRSAPSGGGSRPSPSSGGGRNATSGGGNHSSPPSGGGNHGSHR